LWQTKHVHDIHCSQSSILGLPNGTGCAGQSDTGYMYRTGGDEPKTIDPLLASMRQPAEQRKKQKGFSVF
jgi:hypothetical protein